MRRRTLLTGGAVAVGAVVAGRALAGQVDSEPTVPDVPAGDERLVQRRSTARGTDVDFYTAVPDGHGDGRGLPVCLVLHGGSTTAADFPRLGLGRFLTDAVRRGAAPFVLAGATGGHPHDPTLVHEEVPAWCAERGFDSGRLAALGWSMGGHDSLLFAATFPGFLRAVAAFSPAVSPGDDVFTAVHRLRGVPVRLWCGRQDGLLDDVRELEGALPDAEGTYGLGRHNFGYWSTCLPAALPFVAGRL